MPMDLDLPGGWHDRIPGPADMQSAPRGRRSHRRRLNRSSKAEQRYELDGLALSTVTARRFCDQQEMSLHTATGRSLP